MQKWVHEPSGSLAILGDLNCNYNFFPYEVHPEVEIVIKGQFPYARYMSFSVTGEADVTIASIPDRELIPDPGSTNPFLPGADWNAKNRHYTLKIRFTAPPKGSDHFVPGAGNNIVYAGTLPNGRQNTQGLIGLRIYVPSIGYDDTGGFGLPKIMYCPTKGKSHPKSVEISDQTTQLGNSLIPQKNFRKKTGNSLISQKNFRKKTMNDCHNHIVARQNCDLVWHTFRIIYQVDQNTAYMVSNKLQRDPGKLLFISWKAPTFPDTYHNNGILGNEDMRYWSMSFVSQVGLLGLYTMGDFQAVIDKKGYVNLVISFGAPRPSNVTTVNGFTWIDASELPLIPIQLIYRNNQISEYFPYTAKDVAAGEIVPPEVMKKYYPCGKYVNPHFFQSCCDDNEYNNKKV